MMWMTDFSGNGEDALGEGCAIANSLSAVSVQGTHLFQYNSPLEFFTEVVSYCWCNFYLAISYSCIACFSAVKLHPIESPFQPVCRESLCHTSCSLCLGGSHFLCNNLICLLSVQTPLFLTASYIRSGLFLEPHKQGWAISSLVI